MTSDEELFHRIGEVLLLRPGWTLEPSPTPGGPSSWCFDVQGRVELSVTAVDGVVSVYVLDQDEEIELATIDELVDWLAINRWTYDQR